MYSGSADTVAQHGGTAPRSHALPLSTQPVHTPQPGLLLHMPCLDPACPVSLPLKAQPASLRLTAQSADMCPNKPATSP
jgi:hypothetical protein